MGLEIGAVPFTLVNWAEIPVERHPGETGHADWRVRMFGGVRVRMVDYSPGYLADHWCDRGHILLVLSGEMETELADGRRVSMRAGTSYQVSDFGDAAHRSSSRAGARLFIVD